MAWAAEGDTGFRTATHTYDGGALDGALAAVFEKIVEDEPLKSGNSNHPAARPVDAIDGRVVTRLHDLADVKSESATPGNFVSAFDAADGGGGTITEGPLVPRSATIREGRNQNGFELEQEYRLLGTSLTFGITI